MKYFLSFLVLTLLFSCKKEQVYSAEDIEMLNGYWQIVEVRYPNGSEKKYPTSTTVDYIKLDSLKGFRKKVYPQLDGTYKTSDDAQSFYVLKKADKGFFINYHNELTAWQEALIHLEKTKFLVKSADGIVYSYERYEPIDIFKNAEETK